MSVKVESCLKIDGHEVSEIADVNGLRFYEQINGDSVYVADKQGVVFAKVVADCSQNYGYISHVVDMTEGAEKGEEYER